MMVAMATRYRLVRHKAVFGPSEREKLDPRTWYFVPFSFKECLHVYREEQNQRGPHSPIEIHTIAWKLNWNNYHCKVVIK